MNKKGFTLIEMLVVIAIIAVLVAIIIPTVSSATVKASAAADAANLRSLIAEASTDYLAGHDDDTGLVSYKVEGNVFAVREGAPAPKSKMAGIEKKATIALGSNGTITANFGAGKDVAYFSNIAETGKIS